MTSKDGKQRNLKHRIVHITRTAFVYFFSVIWKLGQGRLFATDGENGVDDSAQGIGRLDLMDSRTCSRYRLPVSVSKNDDRFL